MLAKGPSCAKLSAKLSRFRFLFACEHRFLPRSKWPLRQFTCPHSSVPPLPPLVIECNPKEEKKEKVIACLGNRLVPNRAPQFCLFGDASFAEQPRCNLCANEERERMMSAMLQSFLSPSCRWSPSAGYNWIRATIRYSSMCEERRQRRSAAQRSPSHLCFC